MMEEIGVMSLLPFWILMLAATLAAPLLLGPDSTHFFHVRLTVDIALANYVLAAARMLLIPNDRWRSLDPAAASIRNTWTFAFIAYVIHVTLAFHHVHGWSHGHAMRHTGEVSGFPEGIFISHFFGLLWSVDTAWWWFAPNSYVQRPAWLGWLIHAFMAFIIFNGTVIFESGPVRWIGIGATGLLAMLLIKRRTGWQRTSPFRTP